VPITGHLKSHAVGGFSRYALAHGVRASYVYQNCACCTAGSTRSPVLCRESFTGAPQLNRDPGVWVPKS
jgi:hypothetical protein